MLLFTIRILKCPKKNNFQMVLQCHFRKARHLSKLSALLHQTQDNAQQDFYILFQNKTSYSYKSPFSSLETRTPVIPSFTDN